MKLLKNSTDCWNERIQLLCIAVTVFFIHMSVSFFVRAIFLSSDEFGVTAIAAYFAGENWSSLVRAKPYYGFGQAILYIPIFLLTKNSTARYIFMGAMNSALLATIPVFVYKILKLMNLQSHRKRCVYATVIAIFPSHMVFTKWMWNETLLCVLPWILLYLFLKLAGEKGNKKIDSILLAFFTIYCYAVHGRGILFIAVVLFIICFLRIVHRRRIVHVPCFAVSMVLSYFLYEIVKRKLMNDLWLLKEGRVLTGTLSGALRKSPRLFTVSGVKDIVKTGVAQSMNAILSSYGFLILIAVFFLCLLYAKLKKHPLDKFLIPSVTALSFEIASIFSTLSFLGALAISCYALFGKVGDYLIYTRYFANTLGPVFLIGLLIINETKFLEKRILVLTAIFVCYIPFYFLVLTRVKFQRPFVFFNLYPYLLKSERNYLILACVIILFLFIVILGTARVGRKLNALVLVLIFLEAYYYCGYTYIIPATEGYMENVKAPVEVIAPIQNLSAEKPKVYYHESKHVKTYSEGTFQFMLPDCEVTRIKCDDYDLVDVVPLNSVIYSSENYQLDLFYDNFYQVIDSRLASSGKYVWLYGDDINAKLTGNHILSTQNSYGKTKEFQLEEFSSFVGEYNDGKIVSSGSAGFLLFGPYVSARPGKYQLNISGELYSGELDLYSFFNILYDKGKGTVARISDLSQFLTGNKFDLQVEFATLCDLSNCEFSLFVNEGAQLGIEQVTLEYVESTSIEISLDQFYSQNDVSQDDISVRSSENAGFLLYGPYIPVGPANYQINVTGELYSGELNEYSFFDIVAENGEKNIISIANLNQFITGNKFELSADFEIAEFLDDCEFRVFVNDGVQLEITQVTLELHTEDAS